MYNDSCQTLSSMLIAYVSLIVLVLLWNFGALLNYPILTPTMCLYQGWVDIFFDIYFKHHSNSNRLPQALLFFEIVPCLIGEYGCRSRAELRRFKYHTSSPESLSTVSRPQNENRAKEECLILFFIHWATANEIVWMCFHHIDYIILDVVASLSLSLYKRK